MIARHEGEFPVRLMCRVLEVSVSGYYAYLRPSFARARVGNAHARVLRLVIIAELDIVRIAMLETKANTPLIVHGDRVLSGPISFECV